MLYDNKSINRPGRHNNPKVKELKYMRQNLIELKEEIKSTVNWGCQQPILNHYRRARQNQQECRPEQYNQPTGFDPLPNLFSSAHGIFRFYGPHLSS